MVKKRTLTTMSADELFALAEKRQQEEEEQQRELVRAKITELREKRKKLIAQHKKDLARIDNEIKKLGGKTAGRKKASRGGITDNVIDIIATAGKISTTDLKTELDNRGVVAGNLNQTLAYLKRQGRISSPSRAVYKIK